MKEPHNEIPTNKFYFELLQAFLIFLALEMKKKALFRKMV